MSRGRGVASRVAGGAAGYMAATAASRALGLLSLVVLARVLTPEDFGLMALALVALGFTEAVSNRQFDLGIIRLAEPTPAHFDTAFTIAALWGLAAGAGLLLLAEPLAALFDAPGLAATLATLATLPVLEGLRNTYFVDFERRMQFHRVVTLEIVARVLGVGASIGLAFALRDHWALVGGLVATAAARLALSYALERRRPRPGLGRWREFLGFGGWLTGAGVVEYVNKRADAAFLGLFLGLREVGVFRIGAEIATVATTYLARSLTRALLPGFASVAEDVERLRRGYAKAQNAVLGLMLPLSVGVALAAPEIVLLALGPQWTDSAGVIAVLAPVQAVAMLTAGIQALVVVHGDTRALFMRNLFMASVTVPALLLGLYAYGFLGALWAKMATTLFRTLVTMRLAARILREPLWTPIVNCRRSLLAVAAMAGVVLGLDAWLAASPTGLPAAAALLAAKAVTGGVTYFVVHAALWLAVGRPAGFERSMIDIARPLLRRLARRGRGGAA
jgi:PST family polysaccharide transporter